MTVYNEDRSIVWKRIMVNPYWARVERWRKGDRNDGSYLFVCYEFEGTPFECYDWFVSQGLAEPRPDITEVLT